MQPALKIATFNAENFYMLLDRDYSTDELRALPRDEYLAMNKSIFNPNKDLSKIEAIAATILEGDFDFVGLCEVGGRETLANFNRHFLGDAYECHLQEENSTRGIFVGALVRKGRFATVSATNVSGSFSRNLLRLELASGGVTLRVFVVHLKSQYGQDRGIERRMREVNQLCAMVDRRNCVVMGDFNGILVRGEHQFEFEPFLDLPFRDVLEAMDVPPASRFTHFHFGSRPSFNQLDYIFCSRDIAILDGGTVADLVPVNWEQRRRLPSDHIFLTATIRAFPER